MWEMINVIKNVDDPPGNEYQVDYDKEKRMYRVSIFRDYHFQDEIIFDEVKND